MKNNICCIFNYAPHYNYLIYSKMGDILDCHFYFGNKLQSKSEIKKLKYNELKGFKKEILTQYIFGKYYYLSGSMSLLFKYKKFIISGEPYGISNWLLLIFARIFHRNVYVWSHGWYGRESRKTKIIKKIFFSLAKGTFLYGHYAKDLMTKAGLNPNKLFVIYNSLDYNLHLKLRKTNLQNNLYFNHFGNNNPVLVFIGRLSKMKNISLLLEALVLLNKTYSKPFNAIIVGSGADENDLKVYAKNLDILENIWFYGPCYDETEIGTIFYNSTICVSPGEVGLTAIHSLSYGIPVITHNNFKKQGPEFESIIPGESGMFFEENNVISLAENILNLNKSLELNVNKIKAKCYNIIDTKYNPNYQIELLKNTVI